jgi:methylated-DNA-protein-cysteine methyltransferase-like protein
MDNEGFFQRAYGVVRQIPPGRVATYGQVARMMGEPRKARYVGFACHRVVFADGSLAPGFAFGGPEEQRKMLEAEGVGFLASGKVDMRRFEWEV